MYYLKLLDSRGHRPLEPDLQAPGGWLFPWQILLYIGGYLAIILYLLISVWCVLSSSLLPTQQIALWFLSLNLNLNLLRTYIF